MKQALIDYDIRLDDIPIVCKNKGATDLSKNPVQHSRTKHIKILHCFLRDNVQKENISIEMVPSEDNIADILTKPLKREPFNYLRLGLEMMEQIDYTSRLIFKNHVTIKFSYDEMLSVVENKHRFGDSRIEDQNHLIRECPKPPKDKNQRAFVEGSWSDSDEEDDEKAKDKTCLVAQESNEISLAVDLEPD
nr:copia protein [Tanacetum cinerariifolium]